MYNINLHGRLPEDLPDRDTIDDILLELKDTKKYDINWMDLNSMGSYINWRAQNKVFDNWVERGQVSIMKCEPNILTFDPSEDWSNIPMSTMTFKEERYDIFRYPIRLEVRLKEEVPAKDGRAWSKFMIESSKIIDEVKETYLRLKDYIGPDVIQDQLSYVSFTIDMMVSEYKIISKP